MGSRSTLRFFEIPESLELNCLLRPSDGHENYRLDAYEAEDPDSWTEYEVQTAVSALVDVTLSQACDCVDLLTSDVFHVAFNLVRHFPNLGNTLQTTVCSAFATLCKRIHEITSAVPLNPYFNARDTVDNHTYVALEAKVLTFTNFDQSSRPETSLEGLLLRPADLGAVIRSLANVANFFSCMSFKAATTQKPKNAEEGQLGITSGIIAKKGRATKRKRGQEDGSNGGENKFNTSALEQLVECIHLVSRLNYATIFSADYGGLGKPSGPFMRLLCQTLADCMTCSLGMDQKQKVTQALASVIKQAHKLHTGLSKLQSNFDDGDDYDAATDKEQEDPGDARAGGGGAKNKAVAQVAKDKEKHQNGEQQEEEGEDDEEELNRDCEWLTIVAGEAKKSHYGVLIEALELADLEDLPRVVLGELLIQLRECLSLHAESSQMTSSIQAEFVNIGLFLERLAKSMPLACLACLEELRKLFDVTCYPLRKSVIEAIKTLIIYGRYVDENNDVMEGATEAAIQCAKHRETLLQLLASRQHDTYMYARASLCKSFQDLIEAEALPLRWFKLTTNLALQRLMDKGSQVRQRAMALLAILVADVTNKRFLVKLDTRTLETELDTISQSWARIQMITLQQQQQQVQAQHEQEQEQQPQRQSQPPGHSMETVREITRALNERFGSNLNADDPNALLDLERKLKLVRDIYTNALDISRQIDTSIELANELLTSPVETDQKAAIRYLATCHMLNIAHATRHLPNVWKLSWSNNQNVIDAVLIEFKNIYFSAKDQVDVAKVLIDLLTTTNGTDMASIEKMFELNAMREDPYLVNLDKLIAALLRLALAPNVQIGRDSLPRVALGLVRLVLWSARNSNTAASKSLRILDETKVCALKNLLQATAKLDWRCFAEVCNILQVAATSPSIESVAQFAHDQLLQTVGSNDQGWFAAAQAVVDFTFSHDPAPEVLWTSFIQTVLTEILKGVRATALALAQLLFICGHVAVLTSIAMDKLQGRLRSARAEVNVDNQPDTGASMGMASREEEERDIFERLCEENLTCGGLLGGPICKLLFVCLLEPRSVLQVASDADAQLLRAAAAISICKFAAVSKRFCNEMFTLGSHSAASVLELVIAMLLGGTLEQSSRLDLLSESTGTSAIAAGAGSGANISLEQVPAQLRSTLIISYGDLLCRHPNLLEPWNATVCKCLDDPENLVRKTMVLVFTHLVMNDMVKPKANVLEPIMFLVLDKNPVIASCAKIFFVQVHKKNANTIYNCFPELLHSLACKHKERYPMSDKMTILNMLLECIDKNKQLQSTVAKIATRLHSTEAHDRIAIAIYAQALVRISYDEKCMAKLIQSLPLFRHVVMESDVLLAALVTVARKVKSSQSKSAGRATATTTEGASEASAATAPPPSDPTAAGSATTPAASLKEMGDELMSKLHALFGEIKSPHVLQVAQEAEAILCSTTEALQRKAQEAKQAAAAAQAAGQAQGQTPGGFPIRIKSEPLDH